MVYPIRILVLFNERDFKTELNGTELNGTVEGNKCKQRILPSRLLMRKDGGCCYACQGGKKRGGFIIVGWKGGGGGSWVNEEWDGMGWDGMAILISLFPSFPFVSWSFLSQKENLRFPSHMRTDGCTYSFLGYVKD